MSIESAKAFLERVRNDEDFRKSVKSVGEFPTSEERMEYVKGAGFDFTQDEMASLTAELSDDELYYVDIDAFNMRMYVRTGGKFCH